MALVEFPSLALAQAFYQSPDYQAARALRAGACEAEFVLIEGLPPAAGTRDDFIEASPTDET